jgi:hypothetical protein
MQYLAKTSAIAHAILSDKRPVHCRGLLQFQITGRSVFPKMVVSRLLCLMISADAVNQMNEPVGVFLVDSLSVAKVITVMYVSLIDVDPATISRCGFLGDRNEGIRRALISVLAAVGAFFHR